MRHPTTNVTENEYPAFDNIAKTRSEANVLKVMHHNEQPVKRERLLPSTLYCNERLNIALKRLCNRDLINKEKRPNKSPLYEIQYSQF